MMTARTLVSATLLTTMLGLFASTPVAAQPDPEARPGKPGEMVAFEVQSIDRQSWLVTARDLGSGDVFSFRLPPEAFRGQRFQADLAATGLGAKITVQGARGVRLSKAVVERPIRGGGSGEDVFGAGSTRGRDGSPGPGAYSGPGDPSGPAGYLSSPGGPNAPGGPGAGPADYEVISVDSRAWTVEARGRDGVVTLEVDPQAFVGYRFRASVKDLRAGQGFELLAGNEEPLANCCVVKARSGR